MKKYEVHVYDDGSKSWYLNGKLHREDGPAAEWEDGSKEWYLDGEQVTESDFKRLTSKGKAKKKPVSKIKKNIKKK